MRKLILLVSIILLVFSLISCKQDTNKFTKEEIDNAINLVKENFDFPDSAITEIWYDEEKAETMTEEYIEMGRGSTNGVKSENVIILLSEFEVGDLGGSGLEANKTYRNWQWILTRDSKESDWKIDDWGY